MKRFKSGDSVFCPSLTKFLYTLNTDARGWLYLNISGVIYYFTARGNLIRECKFSHVVIHGESLLVHYDSTLDFSSEQ